MIAVFDKSATEFSSNGVMSLAPSECLVTETINGAYQLQMRHPVDDNGWWDAIVEERIVRVPSHRGVDVFRIHEVGKNLSMELDAYARHITYDMLTDLVLNSAPTNASADSAVHSALMGTEFSGSSDVGGLNSVRWVRKNPIACIMGEDSNSIVNRWGGEVYRLQRRMEVRARLGADHGVSIRHRKNMTGLKFTTDVSGVITRIMPTGLKEDGQTVLELPETYVDSPLIDAYAKIRTAHIHYSDIRIGEEAYPDEAAAMDALRERAASEYEAGADKPSISVNVSFVDLSQTVEYAQYRQLETVSLGDTVHIWHGELGIDVLARVISVEWDCLRKRYTKLTLGKQNISITNMLHKQNMQVVERTDALQQAVDAQTGALLSPGTSYVRFLPSLANAGEILIMDAPEPEDAVNVMRLNRNGFGLSVSGVNGPFVTAATAEGLSATAVTTGTLDAALLRVGSNLAGFSLSETGLTNGNMIQLLSSGYIRLAGFVIDSSQENEYLSFDYAGMRALFISGGTMEVGQNLRVNNNAYFPNLRTTYRQPNLYVDMDNGGELMVSLSSGSGASATVNVGNYSPSVGDVVDISVSVSGGTASSYRSTITRDGVPFGETLPIQSFGLFVRISGIYVVHFWVTLTSGDVIEASSGPIRVYGNQTNMSVHITASNTRPPVGTLVQWYATTQGATGAVHDWLFEIFNPSGAMVKSGTSMNNANYVVNQSGQWQIKVVAADDLGAASAWHSGVFAQ